MLSKCANPACDAPFHYLHDGKLFRIDVGGGPYLVNQQRPVRKTEYFWLCAECAVDMTLKYERERGVIAVPMDRIQGAAAS